MTNVSLLIDRSSTNDRAVASSKILELAKNCGEPCWMILQSFRELSVALWNAQSPDPAATLDAVFNGRIFGERGEVRWVKEGQLWEIWGLRETQDVEASGGCGPYVSRERRYYLWGIFKSKQQRFVEDRVPGVPEYPILGTPADDDRAYIEVREYESPIPVVSPATGNPDVALLEKQLNEPRLVAHRFLRIGSDRDRREAGEETSDD